MSKLILIGGGAAVAIYLVYQRDHGFFAKENEEFRAGFTAGFVTPGPFTILGIAGLVAWNS